MFNPKRLGSSVTLDRGKAVAVGFLERKTGLFLARKQPDRTAKAILEAAGEAFVSFPDDLYLTLPWTLAKERSPPPENNLSQKHPEY